MIENDTKTSLDGEMSEAKFHVGGYAVEVDGEPGAYGVAFPDCPGCCAMGDTVEEALQNASEALIDWLRATDEAKG